MSFSTNKAARHQSDLQRHADADPSAAGGDRELEFVTLQRDGAAAGSGGASSGQRLNETTTARVEVDVLAQWLKA